MAFGDMAKINHKTDQAVSWGQAHHHGCEVLHVLVGPQEVLEPRRYMLTTKELAYVMSNSTE